MENVLEILTEPWDLFDPHDVYETQKLHTFLYFCEDPRTSEFEIFNLDGNNMTLVVFGENNEGTASVFYTTPVYKVNMIEREKLVEVLSNIKTGKMSSTKKNRMMSCLKNYLYIK